ncbi:MAG: hypothetical protein HFJ50_08340 [Clostridia bacterium]|nr:hypothetical protein [Clostridia bacterium]
MFGILAGLPSSVRTIWNLIFAGGMFSTTGLITAIRNINWSNNINWSSCICPTS